MTSPPSTPVELAEYLIREHGQPASGGLVVVPLTVRQIADEVGRSPGTIQNHLAKLDGLGVRVDARARLYDPARLEGPRVGSGAGSGRGVRDALVALVDLVEAAPSQLATAIGVAEELLSEAARSVARPEPGLRDAARRVSGSRDQSTSSSTHQLPIELIDQSIDLVGEEGRADRAVARRSTDDTLKLLGPLVRLCAKYDLPGVTNSVGLSTRLAGYSDSQVRFAVKKLLTETKAGAISQPIGKLANLAAERNGDYFPSDPSPVRLPGDPSPVVEPVVDRRPEPAERVDPSAILSEARARLR